MCAMQRNNWPRQPPNQPPPPPPKPVYRFRWELVGVVLLIGVFLWLLAGAEPSFQFEDLMRTLNVSGQESYVRLACLGAVLVAVTLIVKYAITHRKK